jgi:hypothetical protein
MKRIKIIAGSVIVILLLVVLSGCNLFGRVVPEIRGTWEYTGGNSTLTLEVSTTSVYFYGPVSEITGTEYLQRLQIVEVSNESFNAGETEESDCGYMLVQYIEPREGNPGAQYKYGIIRWAGYDPAADPPVMWFSEGSLDSDNDGLDDYFNTQEEALNGMTVESGAFFTFPVLYNRAELK